MLAVSPDARWVVKMSAAIRMRNALKGDLEQGEDNMIKVFPSYGDGTGWFAREVDSLDPNDIFT